MFRGAWHLPNQSSCLNQNVTQFQHCQPMRNHETEQLQEEIEKYIQKSVRAIVFNPSIVSIYNLSMVWICVISVNCRHRSLATDPGHVTCWDDTAASAHGCWWWQRIRWNWCCNVRGDYYAACVVIIMVRGDYYGDYCLVWLVFQCTLDILQWPWPRLWCLWDMLQCMWVWV